MIKDKATIKGKITATVIRLDEEGLKLFKALKQKYGIDRKLNPVYISEREGIYKKYGKTLSVSTTHNIVTDEGDALVADLMAETPAKTKVDSTNGHIEVGTGWTGTTPKQNTSCNTPTGDPEVMDTTFPILKGTFGNANDNVVLYQATFEAGDLEANGIDEAALINNSEAASGDCLAYGQITDPPDITLADSLKIEWELTLLGA